MSPHVQRAIAEAQREWDMQRDMPDDERDRLVIERFGGNEVGFEAYMTERLMQRLDAILAASLRGGRLDT